METQNLGSGEILIPQTKPHPHKQGRNRTQKSVKPMFHYWFICLVSGLATWLWKTLQTFRKKTKLDKNWGKAKSPDQQVSREWTVKSTRAGWIFILVLMMFYTGFTTVNRSLEQILKEKLEFASEFLVFLLFGEV